MHARQTQQAQTQPVLVAVLVWHGGNSVWQTAETHLRFQLAFLFIKRKYGVPGARFLGGSGARFARPAERRLSIQLLSLDLPC